MGPGLGPARARPGARLFSRARARLLEKGSSPGPARARGQKPGGLKGPKNMIFR